MRNRQIQAILGRTLKQSLNIGDLVTYPNSPGVGTIGEISAHRARVDFFASVAEPVVESNWVALIDCSLTLLDPETRVYWRNPDTGTWSPGRIASRVDENYYVTFPNHNFDFPVPQAELRARWDGDLTDPASVLGAAAHESGYFRNTRLPFLRGLIAQRGASANTASFLSSAVEIYPHQVDAALTVLSDPVQRYLLADEVGLGKTIEAGYVIRQTLLDNPTARIVVITPNNLRRQWLSELLSKFFINDFPHAKVKFRSHEAPETWKEPNVWDLAVVDEAHRLTQVDDPSEGAYPALRALAHSVENLLLLSATPTTSHYKTHLGLLHLLDPKLYSWDQLDQFRKRYEQRVVLADSVYTLDAQFTVYLASSIKDIRRTLDVYDSQFEHLSARVLELLDEHDELRDASDEPDLTVRVEELRAHISETYRLHRRVIRNRRETVLEEAPDADFPSYEVRGRSTPEVVDLSSETHDDAENCVLDWYNLTANERSGSAEDGVEVGAVLKVLATRSGVIANDLVDSLRWRLRKDENAAHRAFLTGSERLALHAAPLLPFEADLLNRIEAHSTGRVAEQSALDAAITSLVPLFRANRRVVIFCGPGQLAPMLVEHVRARFPTAAVSEHLATSDREEAHASVQGWTAGPGNSVLIMDSSGEDGLNLQLADAAIHLRFPWSPNQLEQRMGRLDRYRSVNTVGQSAPARQFRLTSARGDVTFNDSWAQLLVEGYGVFDGSLSTLQDAIDQGIPDVWASAAERGPAGLDQKSEGLRATLIDARTAIDKMDMLESIHRTVSEANSIAPALIAFEERWRTWQDAVSTFASGSSGGINLRMEWVDSEKLAQFDLLKSTPLVDPKLWRLTRARVSPASIRAAFNRSAALKMPGVRLFRSGNQMTDALAELGWNDDRGKATAFSRPYRHHAEEAQPYFGFDYLVEADTTQATSLVAAQTRAEQALRRQADRVLTPFTVRVWVPAFSNSPVSNQGQIGWLNQPYDKDKLKDRNYNRDRLGELLALFDGADRFRAAVATAEAISREHMAAVTDLRSVCDAARTVAEQRLAIARAQARARSAAGHIVGDAESYLLDTEVTSALIEGLSKPNTCLIAAICLVKVPGAARVR